MRTPLLEGYCCCSCKEYRKYWNSESAVRCWVEDRGAISRCDCERGTNQLESGAPSGQCRSVQTWELIQYIFVFFRSAALAHLMSCGASELVYNLNAPPKVSAFSGPLFGYFCTLSTFKTFLDFVKGVELAGGVSHWQMFTMRMFRISRGLILPFGHFLHIFSNSLIFFGGIYLIYVVFLLFCRHSRRRLQLSGYPSARLNFWPPASLAGSMSKQDGKVFIGGLSWETTGRLGNSFSAGSGLCFTSEVCPWVLPVPIPCDLHTHFITIRAQMRSYVDISKTMELYR